jgi:hypothetical protein
MKFSNMFNFSNKTLSIILLILCILVALVFSNMNLFTPMSNVEGLMTLGDAAAVSALIADKEKELWGKLTDDFKDNPNVLAILADPSSPSTQFGKLRTNLKSPDAIKDLTKINLILSRGYKEVLSTLLTQYGTNVDINPTLTQGCDGAESCIVNTKKAVDAVLTSAGGGGGGVGGLGL